MNDEDVNLNEVLISGKINVVTDTNDMYIKFSIIAKKYTLNEFKNVYVSLNISKVILILILIKIKKFNHLLQ